MTLQRFVDVDTVERRNIKTRQPHIDDDRDFEIGFHVLELTIETLAVVLAAQKIVEFLVVVFAARHDHLDPLHRLDLLPLDLR